MAGILVTAESHLPPQPREEAREEAADTRRKASGHIVKAAIVSEEAGFVEEQALVCLFNPTEFSVSKSFQWTKYPTRGTDKPMQPAGGDPQRLELELLFDTYELELDVRLFTDKLFKLIEVAEKTKDQSTNQGRPPTCQFHWGSFVSPPMVITSLRVRFTLFDPEGTPVRALASVTFEQCPKEKKDQLSDSPSPTHGIPGQKLWVVKPGDTIDRIAWEEYKDPRVWRHIAQVNTLDNPQDLRPGQVLVLTPLERKL